MKGRQVKRKNLKLWLFIWLRIVLKGKTCFSTFFTISLGYAENKDIKKTLSFKFLCKTFIKLLGYFGHQVIIYVWQREFSVNPGSGWFGWEPHKKGRS